MKSVIREILLILGFASAVYGISMIYIPAAFIIGGISLFWWMAPAKENKTRVPPNRSGI